MARMKPDERRTAIIAAAVAEVTERGFARTTSRDVARRADVTHGLLHHYFPDHQTLLAQAFDHVANEEISETRSLLAADTEPIAQLRELTEPYGPGGGESAYRLWIEAWGEAAHSPALRKTTAKVTKSWLDLINTVIERGVQAGAFTCEAPRQTAWMILALCDAYAMHRQLGSGPRIKEMAFSARRLAERDLGLATGALDRTA
ncbi:MAG: TetR family transcriptional regulator [Ilumatobacteraceae bacterium]